jgi:HSP20 family molecular chaperone IbpA
MTCPRCGRRIEKGWNFCPFCGFRPGASKQAFGGAFGGIFDRLMKRLAKQMEDIDRQTQKMDRDFEVVDLSPMFRNMKQMKMKPNARGFTIKISRTNNKEPKIDVKTFGNVDNASVQKQVNEQLKRMGVRQQMKTAPEEQPVPIKQPAAPRRPTLPKSKSRFPVPKITEEPKTNVKRVGPRVFVDMEIPGVKSESDINIIELESSVEVRAMAGSKAYFKILTIPTQFRLDTKRFSGNSLHLEFA